MLKKNAKNRHAPKCDDDDASCSMPVPYIRVGCAMKSACASVCGYGCMYTKPAEGAAITRNSRTRVRLSEVQPCHVSAYMPDNLEQVEADFTTGASSFTFGQQGEAPRNSKITVDSEELAVNQLRETAF